MNPVRQPLAYSEAVRQLKHFMGRSGLLSYDEACQLVAAQRRFDEHHRPPTNPELTILKTQSA
jgi:hypothetical protein